MDNEKSKTEIATGLIISRKISTNYIWGLLIEMAKYMIDDSNREALAKEIKAQESALETDTAIIGKLIDASSERG